VHTLSTVPLLSPERRSVADPEGDAGVGFGAGVDGVGRLGLGGFLASERGHNE
jgi:hypothetical protein